MNILVFTIPGHLVQCALPPTSRNMQTITNVLLTLAVAMAVFTLADAVPTEGLTPFGFLMARAYGEPAEHPVMRFISFKPSDGAKFRETFEKKHGPRGRDLIDSLGRGSYKMSSDWNSETEISGASSKSTPTNNSIKPEQNIS